MSHRKKFIFVKTSKTAGTSVESYFEKYCLAEGSWEEQHDRDQHISSFGLVGGRGSGKHDILHSHMPASSIRKLVTNEQWDEYFKFSVIRNPFDRLVSRYFFKKYKNNEDVGKLSKDELRRDFEKVVRGQNFSIINTLSLNKEVSMDYLIRYENLLDGIQYVCNRINVAFVPEAIPFFKSGIRKKMIKSKDLYSDKLIDYVNKNYAEEMSLFGYEYLD
ncbi:sulfotransferase family 2 domain-containing protein [Paraglaciecola marina]|uniref:sulfotransferase family 2 domain-containing protein n=1 Tax=Paraglaciecola marina TaxID=2500157 RepID=UPI001414E12D|nr:sulfotransferase family 2 domain-containing protein [Paraglaciecola marina]